MWGLVAGEGVASLGLIGVGFDFFVGDRVQVGGEVLEGDFEMAVDVNGSRVGALDEGLALAAETTLLIRSSKGLRGFPSVHTRKRCLKREAALVQSLSYNH